MRNWICYIHIYIFFVCVVWFVVHKEIKYDTQVTGLLSFVFASFIHSDAHTEFSNEMFFLSINATPEHHPPAIESVIAFFNGDKISTGCVLCTERVKGNPPFAFMDFSSFHLK